MSNTPLQTAAAAPAVDPNTMLAATPNTGTVDSTPSISQERQLFADEWAKFADSNAPVRSWISPQKQMGPDGQYLSAWYDQAPVDQGAQTAAPAFDANANAGVIAGMVQAATPLPPPPPVAPVAYVAPQPPLYWDGGGGGGGPGSGGGGGPGGGGDGGPGGD